MSLRALLFDVDGTLADTEHAGHRVAYNRAFRRLGLEWRWGPKLYRQLLQQPGGRERLRHFVSYYKPDLGEHTEQVRADPEAWVKEVHQVKSRYFQNIVQRGHIPLRVGVARLMREARAEGLRIAIVTNASRASLVPLLEHSLGEELRGEVELVVCGEEGLRKKPAPDLYLRVLQRLGVQPHESIAIEDSAIGLAAATAAGIPTVVTFTANTRGEDFSEAPLVVDCLGEPDIPSKVLQGGMSDTCVTLEVLRHIASFYEPPAQREASPQLHASNA